jgi:hypothetical protein
MAKQWVPVRLSKRTVKRLEAMRQSLASEPDLFTTYDPADPGLWLSNDKLVSMLLDARDGHARRRRASATRQRAAKRAASPGPDQVQPGESGT